MSKIRLAMIGCGGNSSGHARRMNNNADVQIVGTCDVNTEIANSYIDRNLLELKPRPAAFDDIGKMLAEVKPDAVLISTPHTLHFEQGMQALDAGCHVFMEKPMVTAAEDAYTIAEKVKETGKVFVVGYNTPCSANFYYLRESIRNKTFGALELVTGYITQDWLRATKGAWRQEPELSGGGQAYDSGAHLLNSLCWSVESNVAEVHAFLDNHGSKVDINSSINVRFENGVFAGIVISGNCPSPAGTHMAFIFDSGRVEIDGWSGGWIRVYEGKAQLDPPPITDDMSASSADDNFIDAILGRAEPRTSPMNGIIHSELMDAMYESGRTGQPARPKRRQ
ncbi:MAG: Gfo/Idh/MocA family oxidoreductase [Candidatus Poribacteria bacterium]|nr:Gfo/Idh/MocA family oxidoreductase [Candidatus Poribacteria bacterium]